MLALRKAVIGLGYVGALFVAAFHYNTRQRWLNTWAEKENVNFSAALQRALKEELKIAQ